MKITMSEVKVARKEGPPVAWPDMVFPSGSKVAVVGPAGSGKTMLLRMIVGILTPESGEIRYDDEDYVPQKDIAYQPQMPYVIPSSIRENLRRSLDPAMDAQVRNELINEMLKDVELDELVAERADKLTLDQKRCVAMTRALLRERRCVLLDLPFETEQPHYSRILQAFVKKRVEEMHATLIATYNNPKQGFGLSDIMVVMDNEQVIEYGPTQEVYNNPTSEFAKRYIESY